VSVIAEVIERFRSAAIEKGDFAEPPHRDHELHARMSAALRELEKNGAAGEPAFRRLLDDTSPHVRFWVAAELLSRGDPDARRTLEKLATDAGILGLAASTALKEFHAGRFRSPFP
jgi:hypothetical protein